MEFKWKKRSHRDVNLYFEGYVKENYTDPATGRKKTRYVYHGDYYIFQLETEAWRRFRFGSAFRVLLSAALFILTHILGPLGSVLPWIGIPALISVIPLCLLVTGLFGLLGAKEPKLTIRQYSFGLGQMEDTLWVLLIAWAVSSLGEILYILIRHVFTAREICAAVMGLLAFMTAVWQQCVQSRILAACIHKPESRNTEKTA